MGWEKRGSVLYYYSPARIDGDPRKIYRGNGPAGRAHEIMDRQAARRRNALGRTAPPFAGYSERAIDSGLKSGSGCVYFPTRRCCWPDSIVTADSGDRSDDSHDPLASAASTRIH